MIESKNSLPFLTGTHVKYRLETEDCIFYDFFTTYQ